MPTAPLTNKVGADQVEAQHDGVRFTIPFEGPAPVQAWGSIGANQQFYFRWRGRRASLTVGQPAAAQPRTGAEVWSAITGTTTEKARAEVGEEPLRVGEVYPEGLCVTETTSVEDSLPGAADVFRSLLMQYELGQRDRTPASEV